MQRALYMKTVEKKPVIDGAPYSVENTVLTELGGHECLSSRLHTLIHAAVNRNDR